MQKGEIKIKKKEEGLYQTKNRGVFILEEHSGGC
jgi:hypothetical protein